MSASAGRYVAEGIKHGTASGYTTARCRCEECTAAHSRCQREYREKNPEARRKARAHQAKVYASDPEAAKERVRKSWSRKLKALKADPNHPDHGKNGSYTAGCRCGLCTEARRVYAREHYARKVRASKEGKS